MHKNGQFRLPEGKYNWASFLSKIEAAGSTNTSMEMLFGVYVYCVYNIKSRFAIK